MKHVLTIAGSDSSGGAGIQADLKTFCAFGVYGMTAITAITAQNTQGVYAVEDSSPALVEAQISAVFTDIRVDAVKIGMVSNRDSITIIQDTLKKFHGKNIVLDPVMVSKSGFPLLKPTALSALKELCGIADIVTPNIPEAELLSGVQIQDESGMRNAAEQIAGLGAQCVLIKGGHRIGTDAADLLFVNGKTVILQTRRINTPHTHGTGCTLSSAIASRLALGDAPEAAVRAAKAYITQAIADAYSVGRGVGPVGHLTALYRRAGLQEEQ